MTIYAGTSGFAFKEWKGPFYPEDLSQGEMLRYYAGRLPAVEINNTFYRLPKESVLESWATEVPDGFRFAVKASRRITHFGRLAGVEEPTEYLLRALGVMGPRLGAVLFQLPPNMKKDTERLKAFLDLLPAGAPAAFEFRNESWSESDVTDALAERGFPRCVAETDESGVPDIASTGQWGYVRLRKASYSDDELAAWAERIRGQGWTDAFVFFKHEDAGAGPKLAARFLELVG